MPSQKQLLKANTAIREALVILKKRAQPVLEDHEDLKHTFADVIEGLEDLQAELESDAPLDDDELVDATEEEE